MKRPIKVFVASSGAKKGLADALCMELEEQAKNYDVEIRAQPWHRDVAIPGEDILTSLIEHCGGDSNGTIYRSDYFVAILTPDDMREKKEQWTETPRDNCIFELGLFMGGLGFQHRRCFMLSSVAKDALPSDLDGRTYLELKEPERPSPQSDREAVKKPASRIVMQVMSMKKFNPSGLEIMTSDDLMERERPVSLSGDLDEGAEVLVNRLQPIEEQSREFAATVNANLRAEIRYRYFFHDLDSMPIIARLLYRIATAAPPAKGGTQLTTLSHEQIEENLELISNRLCIHFLPTSGPIEFCIHNARSYQAAVCYLRFPFENKYVSFAQKQAAYSIAKELLELGERGDPSRVFRKTHLFDINHADHEKHKTVLWSHLSDHFKSQQPLVPMLKRVCFGEE